MFCFIFISFLIYFILENEKEENRILSDCRKPTMGICQSYENGVSIPTTKIYGPL